MHIYHLFGLLWIGNYILALGECTLAGAFASWYWAYRKPKVQCIVGIIWNAIPIHWLCTVSGCSTLCCVGLSRKSSSVS